jgi:hypothetical protein
MGFMQKISDAYLNRVKASPQANINPIILGDDKGKSQRFLQDGCASYWFSRFNMGCKNRMGQDWRPNQATMSTALIIVFLDAVKFRIEDSISPTDLNRWVVLGTYTIVTYLVLLRGSVGFLLELGGLKMHAPDRNKTRPYFLIPFMRKVKGEHHDRCHLLPCSFSTTSGIQPCAWIENLVKLKHKQGLTDGPAISDEKGRVLNMSTINQGMHEVLEDLFTSQRDLFHYQSKAGMTLWGTIIYFDLFAEAQTLAL